jgi:hypothetical protein
MTPLRQRFIEDMQLRNSVAGFRHGVEQAADAGGLFFFELGERRKTACGKPQKGASVLGQKG